MLRGKIISIIQDRFTRWTRKLADSHATPLITVGVGHDHNSGQIVLCTLENEEMSNEVLAGFLKYAVDHLEGKAPVAPAPSPNQKSGTTVVQTVARQQLTEDEVLCLISAAAAGIAHPGKLDTDEDKENFAQLHSAAAKLRAMVGMDDLTFSMFVSHAEGNVSTKDLLMFINASSKQKEHLH